MSQLACADAALDQRRWLQGVQLDRFTLLRLSGGGERTVTL
jgi:hypothetical protein